MSEPSAGARFFTDLVDAVRYSQAWAQAIQEQKGYEERSELELQELDELASRISADFAGLRLEREVTDHLSKIINEFVSAAIKQQREKLSVKHKGWIDASSSASEAARLKAVRSLESYLAATPLPVLDEEVVLELSNGTYIATAEYKCAGKIEYEFLLNTANSQLFRSEFTLSALRKGMRLPVRLGKSWLRKESVPDFEKLDDYVLSNARASKNHLVTNFTNQETNAHISIAFSRSDKDSFVTVEYTDGKGKLDVTGEPALSKHFDLVSMKSTMNELLDAILQPKKEKVKLNRLEAQGEDILSSLDCFGFMRQVSELTALSSEALDEMRKLDTNMVRERLKLLGPSGSIILQTLGLSVRASRPKQASS